MENKTIIKHSMKYAQEQGKAFWDHSVKNKISYRDILEFHAVSLLQIAQTTKCSDKTVLNHIENIIKGVREHDSICRQGYTLESHCPIVTVI
jgi:hypothetical protein